jgi:hypothetical protein
MKLLNSLSVIILLSAALAIPQQNHSDPTENFSASGDDSSTLVESANTSNKVTSTPANTTSSTGNTLITLDNSAIPSEEAISSPSESTSSSKNEVNKSEDIHSGIGIPRRLVNVNADVANVGHVQSDVQGVEVGANLGGNGHHYLPYYPPAYPPYYPPQSINNSNNPSRPIRPTFQREPLLLSPSMVVTIPPLKIVFP